MVSGQIYQPSQHLQSSEMIKDYSIFLMERKITLSKKNNTKEKTSATLKQKPNI